MKATAARGHTRKHAGTHHKHTTTGKHHPVHHHPAATAHGHHVTAKAKHPAHAKARGLAPGGIACCAAEALAVSLRLQGLSVTAEDVLALHRLAGADDDTGAPLAVILEAAAGYGLAGFRPVFAERLLEIFGGRGLQAQADLDVRQCRDTLPCVRGESLVGGSGYVELADVHDGQRTSLILGVELPGPHCVVADAGRWWSWGGLHCPCEFPDAVIEEAWCVQWA